MIVTKKDSISWSIVLLAGSLWMIYLTYKGVSDTGLYFQILYLLPILVLLFPPVRHDLIAYIGFFLGPRTSILLALVIFFHQAEPFVEARNSIAAAQKAQQKQETEAKVAKVKSDLETEYLTRKNAILGEIEQQLFGNEPQQALNTIDRFMGGTSDPDLGRLRARAELQVMKSELKDEGKVSLDRRKQIYEALIKDEPGARAAYKEQYQAVKNELAARRKAELKVALEVRHPAYMAHQFSEYDGSHGASERELRSRLHSPESYEHIKTTYVGSSPTTYFITYRHTNAANQVVVEQASVSLGRRNNVHDFSTKQIDYVSPKIEP